MLLAGCWRAAGSSPALATAAAMVTTRSRLAAAAAGPAATPAQQQQQQQGRRRQQQVSTAAAAAAPAGDAGASSVRQRRHHHTSSAGHTPDDAAPAAPSSRGSSGGLGGRFHGVKNLRDLSDALPGVMRPGRVFRTAAPTKATADDIALLFGELAIKDLIDLRSSDELRMDGDAAAAVFQGLSYCRYGRDRALDRVVPDASTYVHGSSSGSSSSSSSRKKGVAGGGDDSDRADVLRVQIPVMEKRRYMWSVLSRMQKRRALALAATAMLDKTAGRRLAIEEVNRGGLEQLYKCLLEDSAPYWAAALRHIARSAEANRPLLFFCKAGKDRTGLLAALLLSVLGATEEQILADYVLSDQFHMVALAGLENEPRTAGLDRAKFERAPREAMHEALRHLQERWGGVERYLADEAGLSLEEQDQLRQLLLLLPPPPPSSRL